MNSAVTFTPSIRQLRAFRAVFHLGKIVAAAEQLSLTQSAVSVLISQLEAGLGTRLFDRTTRSLRPTMAAMDAIAIAERVLRDVDSLQSGLRDPSAARRGRVRLAITPTLAEILLPEVLAKFSALHPRIRVEIDDCAPEQFVSRIVGEQVDLGLGTPERAAADVDTERLLGDTLALVCRQDHPLARKRVVRWTDLDGLPTLTVRPGYGIRQMIDGAAAKAGVSLNVVNDVTFLSTALWMTRAGAGVSVMPTAYARTPRNEDLVVKTIRDPLVTRDISLVTRRGRSLSPPAQALAETIRAHLSRPAQKQVAR